MDTRLAHLQSSDVDETSLRNPSLDCCALCRFVELDGEHINLLPNHELVVIQPLVPTLSFQVNGFGSWESVPAQRYWCGQSWKLPASSKTASSNPSWTVLRQCCKFLFNTEWLAWPCETIAAESCMWSHHCPGWHQVGYSFASRASCHSCCPLCFLFRRRTSAAHVGQAP